MTEPEDTNHKFNPKHRIIGAVVLVALAVLLIPLIFKNRESKPQRMPSAAAGALSGSVAVPAAAPALPMTPGPAVPASSTPAVSPASVAPTPSPVVTPPQPETAVVAPAPAAAPAPESRPAPTKAEAPIRRRAPAHRVVRIAHGWIVQLGAFSQRANALRVRDRLEHKGFRVELDELRVGYRRVARVRVGPVRSRGEARILELHIARQTGIKGVVLAYP
ncbi:MAG: SPOR domain-containing protein [Gammaproteobacteria bacterium]|nr:SPOR domain-containing protein [Gammaproteobacteria bacterium]